MTKVWIITAGEIGEGIEIAWDATRPLVFADSAYGEALDAFRAVVAERITKGFARYEYPGVFGTDLGTDAHAHIIARDGSEVGVDHVELRPYNVIGG